jgi:hypothetical protein
MYLYQEIEEGEQDFIELLYEAIRVKVIQSSKLQNLADIFKQHSISSQDLIECLSFVQIVKPGDKHQ